MLERIDDETYYSIYYSNSKYYMWFICRRLVNVCTADYGACKAFDLGTLSGTLIGITILKCLFASVVGSTIASIGCIAAKMISSFWR